MQDGRQGLAGSMERYKPQPLNHLARNEGVGRHGTVVGLPPRLCVIGNARNVGLRS